MLLELRVANLAIIETCEFECGPGLNILTGETGAGKSIIVRALGLLIGERAEASEIGRPAAEGGNRARIEALFQLPPTCSAAQFLHEQDIALDDGCVLIVREIAGEGRSRIRVNNRLSTASTLRELGVHLLDMHGQHDHQLLLRRESHRSFLDAFGDNTHQQAVRELRDHYRNWHQLRRQWEALTSEEQSRARRVDMLEFQIAEIDAAAISENEEATLHEERRRLQHSVHLKEAAARLNNLLRGDETVGATALLQEAVQTAGEIGEFDARIVSWVQSLREATYTVEECAREAASYAADLEDDPGRLEAIEERLHQLLRLRRKYGESLSAVLLYHQQAIAELDTLRTADASLDHLQQAAAAAEASYHQAAQEIHGARTHLARELEVRVEEHLHSLAMEKARFQVDLRPAPAPAPDGLDEVEFLLAANPGQPPRPLARIASGGELSRVMLALRCALRRAEMAGDSSREVPILVFDEVDAGIGGLTAEAVGEKLQRLAQDFQVFCVTHLPQIARRGDRHYQVRKEVTGDVTRVQVTRLEGDDRVAELARMMGEESASSRRHARELLRAASARS